MMTLYSCTNRTPAAASGDVYTRQQPAYEQQRSIQVWFQKIEIVPTQYVGDVLCMHVQFKMTLPPVDTETGADVLEDAVLWLS